MRALIVMSSFLFLIDICVAQNKSFVDVAPYNIKCGSDLETVFECTDDEIYKFMMQDLDGEACPESDSVAHYNLSIQLDLLGRISESNVTSHKGPETCLAYMNERAKLLSDHMEMKAARRGNKSVAFNKKFSFSHPLDSLQFLSFDSLGYYNNVEEMPRFKGCEEMKGSAKDKEMCGQYEMLLFIYKSLKYPVDARENGIQGTVVVQFVVDKNQSFSL